MSALKKLEDKKEKTELELCIVMAGSLCDQETAAKNLELLKEIETLYREAHRQLAELKTPMPCGHLARYAVNVEDGTQYCCMCDREAQMLALETVANVLDKTATCIQLFREVDARVPGLLFDFHDENGVPLGVRINNAIKELDEANL